MKRPGLSPLLGAATLFLASGAAGAEAAALDPAVVPGAVARLRELPVTALEPAVVAPPPGGMSDEQRRRELTLRFDRNGDGRLDEAERAALRAEIMRPAGAKRPSLLDPEDAAWLRKSFFQELRAAAAAKKETVEERLARRRAESLQRAETPSAAGAK